MLSSACPTATKSLSRITRQPVDALTEASLKYLTWMRQCLLLAVELVYAAGSGIGSRLMQVMEAYHGPVVSIIRWEAQ